MKAAFIERHGGPEVLKYGDMPDPVAAPGEVVVDIVAASVNGADLESARGQVGPLLFDHLIGKRQQCRWYSEAERAGGRQVNDKV